MSKQTECVAEVMIANPLGFHVRPVQRFATMALMFKCDIEVHMRNRTVPGKSIINLVSLGGRCGDVMRIMARGEDAGQCIGVLTFLADSSFFVEDNLDPKAQPGRHVERLARIASCFVSDIKATLNGKTADAKKVRSLARLSLTPTSVPSFEIQGADAEQARAVLDNLVACCFYVEDKMVEKGRKDP
jgi:phosphotransferase system HPr (HPr) family protein